MDVVVMENLFFKRNITRLYDLKGSSQSRYNPYSDGSNKVLLDQNLMEAMGTSPIFLGTEEKWLLERTVWNDTSFLAIGLGTPFSSFLCSSTCCVVLDKLSSPLINVTDYTLVVGLDEEKHELVFGIINFMSKYTWDKHLGIWRSLFMSPTVISPVQYRKRFRHAMSSYFPWVPDQ
ncbi:1-phosphatidylinositol-3-phosphate 5-kinase FAB1A [Forsythia ovata]|uniref:1-phosphatidylinositol-3-phosphate 5-kinase FAB1A n=1 Tax=Forsythia ovata TaxID=205694 RepID=A0ABD1P4Q4_9LAMI